MVLTKMFWKLL